MVDLADFDRITEAQDQGREFPIVGPLREPTGIIVRIAGPDSERQTKARHKVLNRRLWRQRHGSRDTAQTRESDEIELIAAAIMDWSGIEKDGQPFPYSPENAEYLVRTYRLFRDQIDLFASSRAFYIPDAGEAAADSTTETNDEHLTADEAEAVE